MSIPECPICAPCPWHGDEQRGQGRDFLDSLWREWEAMGQDGMFTPQERAAFFGKIKTYLSSRGLY